MSDRFSIYSASFTHAGGTLDLRQLSDQSARANSRKSGVRPGGSLDVQAHILSTADPTFGFGTTDLAAIADLVDPATGLYCTGGHVARYQKRVEGGAFATGTNHMTQTTAKGFLAIDSITADIDSEDGAQAALSYTALSTDGSNPVAQATSVDFTSAPSPLFSSQFYLGGVWIDSTQITGLIRARVAPGIRFGARRSDGGVFARAACSSIIARDPMVELTFLTLSHAEDVAGNFFLSPLGGVLDTYLQRGTTAAGGRIAAATTSHIRYRVTTGSLSSEDITVRGTDDGNYTLSVMPTGTLTVASGVAMP